MSSAGIHPDVLAMAQDFAAVGMSTPTAAARKGNLLLQPRFDSESVAIVVVDAVRCATTLVGALAAGAGAITISVKGSQVGTTSEQAEVVARKLSLSAVAGGELHGRPIVGGVIGNSPRAVKPGAFVNQLIHFSSTNFGATFTTLMPLVKSFQEAGGRAEVFIGTFANCESLARHLQLRQYDRYFLAGGGFYDFPSLEDLVCCGELLSFLGLPIAEMDDEAYCMFACFKSLLSSGRAEAFRQTWIGRCLKHFADPSVRLSAVPKPVVCSESRETHELTGPRRTAKLSEPTHEGHDYNKSAMAGLAAAHG